MAFVSTAASFLSPSYYTPEVVLYIKFANIVRWLVSIGEKYIYIAKWHNQKRMVERVVHGFLKNKIKQITATSRDCNPTLTLVGLDLPTHKNDTVIPW